MTKKHIEFQLIKNNARERAQKAIDHAIKSGRPAKVGDLEILAEIVKLLKEPKFGKYDIMFFRVDGSDKKMKISLDQVDIALHNSIELRPIK